MPLIIWNPLPPCRFLETQVGQVFYQVFQIYSILSISLSTVQLGSRLVAMILNSTRLENSLSIGFPLIMHAVNSLWSRVLPYDRPFAVNQNYNCCSVESVRFAVHNNKAYPKIFSKLPLNSWDNDRVSKCKGQSHIGGEKQHRHDALHPYFCRLIGVFFCKRISKYEEETRLRYSQSLVLCQIYLIEKHVWICEFYWKVLSIQLQSLKSFLNSFSSSA